MKIFAHKGASGYAPENTLIAIKKAIEMKVEGIEIDIQLTRDGRIVLMHDWKVDRTTIPQDMMLNIEIKDTARHHSKIEEKLLEVLKKYPDKFENIIVSSFHHDKIKKLQELEPKLKLALLTNSEFIEIEKYLSTNGVSSYSYHPEINHVSKEDIEKLHAKGVKIFVWTVNKEEDLNYLVKLGVDGVISDYPDLMKELIS